MLNPFAKNEDSPLSKTITDLHKQMNSVTADSPEYAKMTEQLEKLTKLLPKKSSISPDTLAIVFGNLAGILLILNYERVNVIGSKALSFIIKPRI